MAAASVKEPIDSPDWIFEPKLDGYRAITVIDSTGKARLWSRNHLPLEPKFPTIQDGVNEMKLRSTILDGEIGVLDKDGLPRFQLLQQWQQRPTAPVVLYLFDLLWSTTTRPFGRGGQRDYSGVLERHVAYCRRADPAYGDGVAGAVKLNVKAA